MATKRLVFFDTNILVYQFDVSSVEKQKIAISIIEKHLIEKNAVISSQVVQEFMNVSMKKFQSKMSVSQTNRVFSELLEPLCAHFPSIEYYKRSLALFSLYSISYYDALIVQAAIDLGCSSIYSEDLQGGQYFGQIKVVNPFI